MRTTGLQAKKSLADYSREKKERNGEAPKGLKRSGPIGSTKKKTKVSAHVLVPTPPTTQEMEDECDTLFSLRVRTAADWTCRKCGRYCAAYRWFLECAHVVRRAYLVTRWRDDNAIALCRFCHQDFTRKGLPVWKEWLLTIGIDYDPILVDARHGTPPDVRDVLAALESGQGWQGAAVSTSEGEAGRGR